jgi:hypothetical protein
VNSSGMCRRKMDATRFDRRKYVPKITTVGRLWRIGHHWLQHSG